MAYQAEQGYLRVIQKVKEVNAERRYQIQGRKFNGKSYDDDELKKNMKITSLIIL